MFLSIEKIPGEEGQWQQSEKMVVRHTFIQSIKNIYQVHNTSQSWCWGKRDRAVNKTDTIPIYNPL